MARVFGICQAWRSVREMLGEDGPQVVDPAALCRLIEHLKQEREAWRPNAEAQLRQQLADLADQITRQAAEVERVRKEAKARMEPEILYWNDMLTRLSTQGTWIVRLCRRWTTIPRVKHKLARARQAYSAATYPAKFRCEYLRNERARFEHRFSECVNAIVQRQEMRLERLSKALVSKEFVGAKAELEMAALLAGLPDEFIVLHDVHLQFHRAIHFDDKWLKTAQCDHVVVGPMGIFVIESKRWSQEFAAGPDRFDPFEQVGRARFLCQCILRDHGYQVTPHDIIANAGTYLSKPAKAHGQICAPQGVARHILGSRERLDADQIAGIAEVLRQYMN